MPSIAFSHSFRAQNAADGETDGQRDSRTLTERGWTGEKMVCAVDDDALLKPCDDKGRLLSKGGCAGVYPSICGQLSHSAYVLRVCFPSCLLMLSDMPTFLIK